MPVDITDEYGRTALLTATVNNRTDVVRYLLDKGADVNKQNHSIADWGKTALHFASNNNNTDVMRMLLQHGAIKDIEDNFGIIPIFNAFSWNNKEAVHLLAQD